MTWPRDEFVRAVWGSDSLKPLERLVALVYADHAGEDEFAWVTYPRLQQRTGLSRDALARALAGLRETGWLVTKEASRQQKSTRYWLRVPVQQSGTQTAETVQSPASQTAGYPHASASQTADDPSPLADGPQTIVSSPSPDASPLPPDTSSPPGRPDHSSHHSPEGKSDDESAREADARAAAELLARFAPGLDEQTAVAAVAAVVAAKQPSDPARYMSRFSIEDVQRWATKTHTAATAPEKCGHGVVGGFTTFTGTGENLSRRCGRCESSAPATEADWLRATPLRPTSGRRNDIDWEAAAARAAARDARDAAGQDVVHGLVIEGEEQVS